MADTLATSTPMTDALALARVLAWLSPVLPTGGFAYSSGLEAATQKRLVHDDVGLNNWQASLLENGRLRNDAIFVSQSVAGTHDRLRIAEINALALASAGSAQMYLETTAQGSAFCRAARAWPNAAGLDMPDPIALPVAVGMVCGPASVEPETACIAYLHAFIANQLQIAIRLSVFGQNGAAHLLATLEPIIVSAAKKAVDESLDDLGSATIMADIVAMLHETQDGRLFRS